jgi:hypothetical protein
MDVWTAIFKKYGTAAIVFSIIASLSIWGLAHWAASPGSEVTVLWGLVKYTKSAEPLRQSTTDQSRSMTLNEQKIPGRSDTTKASVTLQPITIDAQSGVTGKQAAQAIKSLRAKYGLRELSTFESGKKVSELPSGTFCFTLLPWIEDSRSINLAARVGSLTAFRYKRYDSDIEVHLTSHSGIRVIGFTSESDAASVSHLSGESSHGILLSAVPWGTMTTLVSMPVDRIQSSHAREIQASTKERFDVLELVVK